ncbi:hypothetical protein lerEdw1_002959, partial [Lerista edwardsae]
PPRDHVQPGGAAPGPAPGGADLAPPRPGEGEVAAEPGVDALLDLLLCVHQECSGAPLRRERNVQQFLEWESRMLQVFLISFTHVPFSARMP